MRRLVALFALCFTASAALAGEITSAYTKFDIDKCKRLSASVEEAYATFECKGYGGLAVYWAEGDLRTSMAYGPNGFEHCSAQQTFGHFNLVVPTIEWRLENGKAFAAIQRWRVSDLDDASKYTSWLGVTRIEKGNSCRVAIIEGAMPNANVLAREAADTLARSFNCQTDTAKVIARKPVPANELMSGTPCGPE